MDERKKRKGQQTAIPDQHGANRNNGKMNRDSLSTDSSKIKRASVWILNGNTLTRRFIRTGLEDGTQVQVLSGLTANDEIVDGVQHAGAKANQNIEEVHLCRNEEVDETAGQPEAGRAAEMVLDNKINKYGK